MHINESLALTRKNIIINRTLFFTISLYIFKNRSGILIPEGKKEGHYYSTSILLPLVIHDIASLIIFSFFSQTNGIGFYAKARLYLHNECRDAFHRTDV